MWQETVWMACCNPVISLSPFKFRGKGSWNLKPNHWPVWCSRFAISNPRALSNRWSTPTTTKSMQKNSFSKSTKPTCTCENIRCDSQSYCKRWAGTSISRDKEMPFHSPYKDVRTAFRWIRHPKKPYRSMSKFQRARYWTANSTTWPMQCHTETAVFKKQIHRSKSTIFTISKNHLDIKVRFRRMNSYNSQLFSQERTWMALVIPKSCRTIASELATTKASRISERN